MSNQVDPRHNVDALLVGTGEFSFCEGAATVAATKVKGFRDFGDCQAFTPKPSVKKLEHFGTYRGKRRVDKSVDTESRFDYMLKLDQLDYETAKLLMYADDGSVFAQSALTNTALDTILFVSGTPSDKTKLIELYNGGVKVRSLTSAVFGKSPLVSVTVDNTTELVTETSHGRLSGDPIIFSASSMPAGLTAGVVYYVVTPLTNTYAVAATVGGSPINITSNGSGVQVSSAYVEGTDYELDLTLGRVRFLATTGITTTVYPYATATAITSSDNTSYKGILPLTKSSRTGVARLTVYDQDPDNPVVLDHQDFSCVVTVESATEVDGTKWCDVTLGVTITNLTGTAYLRRKNLNTSI